jgi:hypothetical protein
MRPEKKSIATNFMPEGISDFPYDFKKMLVSYRQELGWASSLAFISGNPKK